MSRRVSGESVHVHSPENGTAGSIKSRAAAWGLAITKMIVTMMERYDLPSRASRARGSVFTVELDLPTAGAPEEMKLPAIRVLVADDDPETCRSAAGYLRGAGSERRILHYGGREAVEHGSGGCQERRTIINMIFLDWRMPDLEGTNTARDNPGDCGRGSSDPHHQRLRLVRHRSGGWRNGH